MNTSTPNRHGSAVITFPSETELLITRSFDAPAQLVYEALNTPELVKRWWGFETSEWKICDIDLRVGGKWHYKIVDRGMDVEFYGEFQELDPPNRIVSTEVFAPFPDAGSVNTITLDESDGVTTMQVLCRYQQSEHRDAVIASGMEGGMQVSYDRLEDIVAN